jgi:hypothetical protein
MKARKVHPGVRVGHAMGDPAGSDLQGRVEVNDAVALVVVRVTGRPPRAQGERQLRALQRLDRRLLVDAEHHSMLGRVEVEADDVVDLGGKLRVPTDLVGSYEMRFEPVLSGGCPRCNRSLGQSPCPAGVSSTDCALLAAVTSPAARHDAPSPSTRRDLFVRISAAPAPRPRPRETTHGSSRRVQETDRVAGRSPVPRPHGRSAGSLAPVSRGLLPLTAAKRSPPAPHALRQSA